MNDLENDFDDVLRGYGHSRHIANVVTGAVLQAYDKVNYTDVDSIKLIEKNKRSGKQGKAGGAAACA